MAIHEVAVAPRPIDPYTTILAPAEYARVRAGLRRLRSLVGGATVWNVNSTGLGGGVAEMLRPLLAYLRGAEIDARWVVVEGPSEFFAVTRRLHTALHGEAGDRSALGASERRTYEQVLAAAADDLLGRVRPGDVVVLHDPQTAGLGARLVAAGTRVVWRCHVGCDAPNAEVEAGWRFLLPYLADVSVCVFSRRAYVPPGLPALRSAVVTPCIDAFSAKNVAIDDDAVEAILVHAGLLAGLVGGEVEYTAEGGARRPLVHCADVMRLGPAPPPEAPLVVQVSRWDQLKDPVGVMLGFAEACEAGATCDAHLVLAGPSVHAVADDPDGARAFDAVTDRYRALPHEIRRRIHLAMLPMHDVDENAAMVNALQRRATVVVQKSLHEGFGLTVSEAMWKGRAVLASAVGGIQDQVTDGVDGVLVRDPDDLPAFAAQLARLLADAPLRARLGAAAHATVRDRFLTVRQFDAYADVLERLGCKCPE